MKIRTVFQHDERDCGAACLAMIADYYGVKKPLAKFREMTKTDRNGTNLYGLVDAARQINIKAKSLSGTETDFKEWIESKNKIEPFVALLRVEDLLHYIVVYTYADNKLKIADPAKGKYEIPLSEFNDLWAGYIVTFEIDKDFQKSSEKHGIKDFFSLLKGQYSKLATIMVISITMAAIGVVGAFVFQLVIDNYVFGDQDISETEQHEHNHEHDTEGGDSDLHEEDNDSRVVLIIQKWIKELSQLPLGTVFIALILLYLLQALIQFVRGYLIVMISKKIDIRLSLKYYNHIVDLPMESITVRQTGEYMSRFSDTYVIREAISGATVTLILDTLMVIGIGITLYLENRWLFFIACLMLIVYAIVVLLFRKPVEKSSRDMMEKDARLQSYFKESIDGIDTIKGANANEIVKSRTTKRFYGFINAVVKNSLISISQETIVSTVELVGTVIILWVGFSLVIQDVLSIGMLMTFYALLGYFTEPVKNLINLQPTIQSAIVAADRLNDVLLLDKEIVVSNGKRLSSIDRVSYRDVSFRYGNRELTLKHIDFEIERGNRVAIVGESGSGKTTLAKLLMRLYDPESGQICINGKDMVEYDVDSIRNAISYVDQNTFLFADTIKNNLKLSNPTASDEEMIEACKKAHANSFIEELPFGYDTPLEENGLNISGGQRQRLSIARALLKKPELLILDEATSNLDTITERGIKDTILNIDHDITCIIIAHRLSTIKQCDKILVMDNGEIVESGSHDDLIKEKGLYYKMAVTNSIS